MAFFLNVFLYMIPSKTDPGGLFSAQFIWSQRAMPRHLAPTHRDGPRGHLAPRRKLWRHGRFGGVRLNGALVSHRHITCGAMCVHVNIYIYTLIHVSSCTCMHAYIYVYIYMYTHVVCVYIYIYVYTCICIYIYTCICICFYLCIWDIYIYLKAGVYLA